MEMKPPKILKTDGLAYVILVLFYRINSYAK
jgi:hypothetical protein